MCKYYDNILENENLEELINTSDQYINQDIAKEDLAIVPPDQYPTEKTEKKADVQIINPAKKSNFKEAYAITTKYAKEAVGMFGQWAFKWATYPTLGCTNGKTKGGIEDLVGKNYFDAEKAAKMNCWANCVTYPLIAYGVCGCDIGPIANYAVPIVVGIAVNIAELWIRCEGMHDDELVRTPTLFGALISTPVKAMAYLAKGIKEGYKKLTPSMEEQDNEYLQKDSPGLPG